MTDDMPTRPAMKDIDDVLAGRRRGCIVQGDGLEVLWYIHHSIGKADMVFADPPDNLGLKYDGFNDQISEYEYERFLERITQLSCIAAPVVWLSVFHKYQNLIWYLLDEDAVGREIRQIIWHFTFGQHRTTDLANNYRPLFRIAPDDFHWNTDAIRVPSKRQTKYNDKRANPEGRVPGDVWEFPRVCGTFKERCPWHPTQHPEALLERIILMSTKEGDLVVDPFSGTGTTCVVANRLNRRFIGVDISKSYVEKSRARLR